MADTIELDDVTIKKLDGDSIIVEIDEDKRVILQDELIDLCENEGIVKMH